MTHAEPETASPPETTRSETDAYGTSLSFLSIALSLAIHPSAAVGSTKTCIRDSSEFYTQECQLTSPG